MTIEEARARIAEVFEQVAPNEISILLVQVIEDRTASIYLKPAVFMNRLREDLDRMVDERGWHLRANDGE
ncbi:MAG: hypothetical protein OXF79_22275 [Chloroflexi bacterium]|nr:hypothetical protein [Chloroflexota bacterium]